MVTGRRLSRRVAFPVCAECGVLVVCETEAPIGFAARPPLPSGIWIRLAPGGRLSNPEEELKDGGPRCAGGKMATASVSAASESQFSVRGGDRVGSRRARTALRVLPHFSGGPSSGVSPRPAGWRAARGRVPLPQAATVFSGAAARLLFQPAFTCPLSRCCGALSRARLVHSPAC